MDEQYHTCWLKILLWKTVCVVDGCGYMSWMPESREPSGVSWDRVWHSSCDNVFGIEGRGGGEGVGEGLFESVLGLAQVSDASSGKK